MIPLWQTRPEWGTHVPGGAGALCGPPAFLSEDPIRFAAGVNFYRYVLNNPINWIDPFGLDCQTWWFVITCSHGPTEVVSQRAAEYEHERQHVSDSWNDPYNWFMSCEEKERRGFEAEMAALTRSIEAYRRMRCEGKRLNRYQERDFQQAEQMLKENQERFKNPNFFSDYCILSKRP